MTYRGYDIVSPAALDCLVIGREVPSTGWIVCWTIHDATVIHHWAPTRRAARAWCDRHPLALPNECACREVELALSFWLTSRSPTEALGQIDRAGVGEAAAERARDILLRAGDLDRARERN